MEYTNYFTWFSDNIVCFVCFLINSNRTFFFLRSRRPVSSLPNSNVPISHTKKGQNNYFPFLPSSTTTGQNQTSLNTLRSTPAMGNFLSTQNGQAPPSQMMNGDMGQNFPPMNVNKLTYLVLFVLI